jgi:hypothetical protein
MGIYEVEVEFSSFDDNTRLVTFKVLADNERDASLRAGFYAATVEEGEMTNSYFDVTEVSGIPLKLAIMLGLATEADALNAMSVNNIQEVTASDVSENTEDEK